MRYGIGLILLATLAGTASAQSRFYKCEDKWGQPIFSQRPCGAWPSKRVGSMPSYRSTTFSENQKCGSGKGEYS
ncbi:DUF4124 domain-containing protein [Kineobactrum sediminis]|uniref:DUF4124 domain-containing protein n=1 Tax=Kineobactrum sediminis TaxID=1905677 RepID=UPI003B981C87